MKPILRATVTDQLTELLREGALSGRWGAKLPSVRRLAAELDVAPNTVMAALRRLDAERFFIRSRGGRLIPEIPGERPPGAVFRVGILFGNPVMKTPSTAMMVIHDLRHRLEENGYAVFFMGASQAELGGDPEKVGEAVLENPADAWVLMESPRATLEWFLARRIPVLSFGGRSIGLPLPEVGSDAIPALRRGVRELLAGGHRRIVLVCPEFWRAPSPGVLVRTFLEELSAAGVSPGAYATPAWEPTPEGLRALLESLFLVTPPTALIFADYEPFLGTLGFLARRRLRVPEDVSLLTMEGDPGMAWMTPEPTRIASDFTTVARRIARWVTDVAVGVPVIPEPLVAAEFVRGGTIGPARPGR